MSYHSILSCFVNYIVPDDLFPGRAKLFFKLFVVMGVTHIFEFISWSQSVEETMLYWIVLDMFNILQSTGVFFIFVCKRKILNQLEQKYPSLKSKSLLCVYY